MTLSKEDWVLEAALRGARSAIKEAWDVIVELNESGGRSRDGRLQLALHKANQALREIDKALGENALDRELDGR